MKRSIWKAPYSRVQIIQSRAKSPLSEKSLSQRDPVKRLARSTPQKSGVPVPSISTKIWSRAFMITPSDLLKRYAVYNGKRWIEFKVTEQMIGHRFGEFCSTRQATAHKVYKQRQSRKPANKRSLAPMNLG